MLFGQLFVPTISLVNFFFRLCSRINNKCLPIGHAILMYFYFISLRNVGGLILWSFGVCSRLFRVFKFEYLKLSLNLAKFPKLDFGNSKKDSLSNSPHENPTLKLTRFILTLNSILDKPLECMDKSV